MTRFRRLSITLAFTLLALAAVAGFTATRECSCDLDQAECPVHGEAASPCGYLECADPSARGE